MDNRRFDSLVKPLTTGGSRRGLLHTLSAGALAAVVGRFAGEGAEAKKKRTKKAKKGDVNKLCKPQVGGCIDILTPVCAGSPDPEACVAAVHLCCPELGTCDMSGYFTCLEANAP
jgi:hypothetical protein